MTTQISSKLAAFAAALMMSSFIMGGVTYLLAGASHASAQSVALAAAASQSAHGRV
jgi:hypothetical protein